MVNSQSSARCGAPWANNIVRVLLILCLLCHLSPSTFARPLPWSRIVQADDEGSRRLFVFGDSYVDTGNTPYWSPSWLPPYGMTWPGFPTGRFSNGKLQTDILALSLGVSSPIPVSRLLANRTPSGGINFAVAGSGVTSALRSPRLAVQIGWFQGLANAGLLGPRDIKRAVFLISVSGNDYGAYNGSTLKGYLPLTHNVVWLMDQNLRVLYSAGARNFVVSSISPLPCLPMRTFRSVYAECERNATVEQVVKLHNHLLGRRLTNFTKNLDGSRVLYLQQTEAVKYVLNNLAEFNLTSGLRPCLLASAGGMFYNRVCDDPEQHFFWDGLHPTQAGWNAVMSLYTNRSNFTSFSPSLNDWLKSLPP